MLVIAYYVIKNKKNCKFNKLNKFLEQTLKGNKSDSSAEQTSVNVPRLFDLRIIRRSNNNDTNTSISNPGL